MTAPEHGAEGWTADAAEELRELYSDGHADSAWATWGRRYAPRLLQMLSTNPEVLAALKNGFDLYGYDAPDGRWPIDKRHEFDRLARAALARASGAEDAR